MFTSGFRIVDWAARSSGRETKAQWSAWACSGTATAPMPANPSTAAMPMLLRRRLGKLGQLAVGAAYEAGAAPPVRYVFCSRHGEFGRTLDLLRDGVRGEPLSPMEFSVSVHNALAGLLSIATKATGGHTALAAGADTFAYGLVESAASLATAPDDPVLLVYFDELLPSPFDELVSPGEEASLACALLLNAPGDPAARGELVEFAVEAAPGESNAMTTRQASDFLRFLASGAPAGQSVGDRIGMRWRRAG
jgi:hypothetical protein